MLDLSQLRLRRIFSAMALAAALVPFQSCDSPYRTKGSSIHDNGATLGGGVDGMRYQTYDTCGNQVGISELIDVAADFKSALVTRENCQDLSTPKPVDVSNLVFSTADNDVFGLNGHAFDQQVSGNQQKITVLFCQSTNPSSNVQALIWTKASDLSTFYANLSFSTGETSGTLTAEQLSSQHYSSSANSSAQFDLSMSNNSSGTLSYSLPSGSTGSSVAVNCSTQSAPLIVQQLANGVVALSPTTYQFTIQATNAGHLLVVGMIYGPGQKQTTTSIKDDAGNTYSLIPNSYAWDGNAGSTEIWYAVNSKAGATHVVVTEGGAWRPQVFFAEVSGIDMNDPLDGAPAIANSQPAASRAAAPAVTTSRNAFIFSVLSTQYSLTSLHAPSNFTAFPIYDGDGAAYFVPSTAGTYNAIWDQQSGTYSGSSVAFKSAW